MNHPKTHAIAKIELHKHTNFGNPHGPQEYANADKFTLDVIDLGVNATCKQNGQCILVPWGNLKGLTYGKALEVFLAKGK